jgi:predicted nucleic acid-binding Zn ribbon protein
MPRYDFECPGGDETIEIEFPITAAPIDVMCTICGAKMTRIYTPTPTIFKGDGWAGKS